MDNLSYAESLRKLADFYESHSEIPLPEPSLSLYSGLNTKADAQMFARAVGKVDKDISDSMYTLIGHFGDISLKAVFWREAVCERVKVGTKYVPERIVPAIEAQPEQLLPATEEEIYEWHCAPLMEESSAS